MSLLIKRIQEPDIHTSNIGKIKECLNITVIGLSHITTVEAGDIFPFVYMSVNDVLLDANQLRSVKMRKNLMTLKLKKSPI